MPQIELVTRASVAQTDWWSALEPAEQRTVLIEAQALVEEMVKFGLARLAIGEHLANLQAILEPKRIFQKFLKSHFRQSKATAYRYIERYQYVKDRIPDLVLRTAIAHGYDIIDAQIEIMDKMPPPKTQDRAKIVKYLEKLEAASKEGKAAEPLPEYDEETLLREAFNFVLTRLRRLPNNSRTRSRWFERLTGMVLSEAALRVDEVAPVEVPEKFRVVRGRPRLTA
jgi:hypothetical protein